MSLTTVNMTMNRPAAGLGERVSHPRPVPELRLVLAFRLVLTFPLVLRLRLVAALPLVLQFRRLVCLPRR